MPQLFTNTSPTAQVASKQVTFHMTVRNLAR
jgi:hypothetical protein